MTVNGQTGRLLRWHPRLSRFDLRIIHLPGRKHQATEALFRLYRDKKPELPTDNEVISTFKNSFVFPVLTRAATKDANATANDTTVTPDEDTDDDLDDSTDDEELELYTIYLYQAAYLEADVDPDHRDDPDHADSGLLHNSSALDAP